MFADLFQIYNCRILGPLTKVTASLTLDKWSFFTLTILYMIINIMMIAVAAG
jgi:hypothetical protein